MKWRDRVFKYLADRIMKRATLRDPGLINLWGSSKSVAGITVTTDTSLRFSPVWGAVMLLARDVAKLPIMVSKVKRVDNSRSPDRTHQAYKLFRIRPNYFQSPYLFKMKLMSDAMLHGNSYAWLRRDEAHRVIDMLPLEPTTTDVRIIDSERYYYLTRLFHGEEEFAIHPEDILHLRGLSRDGIMGEATIDNARDSIGVGMAGQEYTGRFFSNNTNSSLVFEHPGTLDGDVATRLRASIERKQAGLENAWKPWILEDGMVAKPISNSNQDAELPALAQMSIRDVSNYFCIPASKLGDVSKVSFSSLEEDSRAYVDQAVDPWLCQWEEEIALKLFSQRERFSESRVVEFDRKRLNRANLQVRGDFLSKMIQMGVVSRNEARQDLSMNSVDGGDEFLVPVNLHDPSEPDAQDPPDPPDTPDPPPVPSDDGDSNDPARAEPDIAEIALQAFESLCRRVQKEGRTDAFETAWHRRMVPILGEDISRQAYDRLAALASNEDLEKAPARLITEFLK